MTDSTHSLFRINSKEILKCDTPKFAYIYYQDRRFNILTNQFENIGVDEFIHRQKLKKLSKPFKNPYIVHYFYEYGLYLKQLKMDLNLPLAMEIQYSNAKTISLKYKPGLKFLIKQEVLPDRSIYRQQFAKVLEHLERGDCYQINLTHLIPFQFNTDDASLSELFQANHSLSEFAHFTQIENTSENFDTLYSNSPECLFMGKKTQAGLEIHSLPIKGTIPKELGQEKLLKSIKDQNELYMISDMVRNDLSMIESPMAEVISPKKILRVPKLFHLYSHLKVTTESSISLGQIIESLFPAASITGAPKFRVMELIQTIETSPRGAYCGSTLLAFQNTLAASVNIRTCSINSRHFEGLYGAGGGITIKSNWEGEYNEMLHKWKSFKFSIMQ
jgi:anthranilate/para-aminobenzoate synthase component I